VQQVNIPALPYFFDGVTEFSSPSGLLDYHSLSKDAYQVNPVSVKSKG